MLRVNENIAPDFAARVQARGCKAETFPHNQLTALVRLEGKRLAYCQLNGAIALVVKSPSKHREAEAFVAYSQFFERFTDRLDFLPKTMYKPHFDAEHRVNFAL